MHPQPRALSSPTAKSTQPEQKQTLFSLVVSLPVMPRSPRRSPRNGVCPNPPPPKSPLASPPATPQPPHSLIPFSLSPLPPPLPPLPSLPLTPNHQDLVQDKGATVRPPRTPALLLSGQRKVFLPSCAASLTINHASPGKRYVHRYQNTNSWNRG